MSSRVVAVRPHAELVRVGKPPSPTWRCSLCHVEGTLAEVRATSCSFIHRTKRGAVLTPDEQLALWARGDDQCPNEHGECCPDFACCHPASAWPLDKRGRFLAADQGTREKMMMGALGALAEGAGAYVTRGEPGDHA